MRPPCFHALLWILSLPSNVLAFIFSNHNPKSFTESNTRNYASNSTTFTASLNSKSKGILIHWSSDIGMQALHSRLQDCGVKKYFFVKDNEETDQLAPSEEDPSLLVPTDPDRNILKDCVHVKTLIWKGSYLKNATRRNGFSEIEHSYTKNVHNSTFYFVTALKIDDKVDPKKLRHIVSREWPSNDGSLLIQLADRSHAELISGFVSGSIPPGWHNIPLKLFIDDRIIMQSNQHNDGNILANYETIHGIREGSTGYSRCIMSVGSGSSDYSLHVSLLDILQSSIWENTSTIKMIHDGLDSDFEFSFGECTRKICSFTRKVPTNKLSLSTSHEIPIKIAAIKTSSSVYLSNNEATKNVTRRLFHATAKKREKQM